MGTSRSPVVRTCTFTAKGSVPSLRGIRARTSCSVQPKTGTIDGGGGCPRAQVVLVPEPHHRALLSPKCRGRAPWMRRYSSTQTGGREGLVPVWGRFLLPSALVGPAQPWNSWPPCHMTRSVPDGTVCGTRPFSGKLCCGVEKSPLPGRESPGSEAVHLASLLKNCCQKLLPKTAVGKSDRSIPPPTPPPAASVSLSAGVDHPVCLGRAAAGASWKPKGMSHNLVYLPGQGQALLRGHPSYQGGPFPSAPLSQPCPAPSLGSAAYPPPGPHLASPTVTCCPGGAASLDGGGAQ